MYKRILSVLLVILICFCAVGCSSDDSQVFVEAVAVSGYEPLNAGGSLTMQNTDGLEKACENEFLELYYNKETFVVTVFDKRNGKSYTTNPANEEAMSNNTNLALLNLVYSDTQGKTGTIDSYTQSVRLNQVETKKGDASVTFIYSIGDVSAGIEVTPSVLSDERFKELLEKADSGQKKTLERRYSYIKDSNSWSRRKIASPVAVQELIDVFNAIGYTAEDLASDNAENGVSSDETEKLAFVVPLEFTLDGDSIVTSIDMSAVEYPESNPLVQIEFMQFFGAANSGAQGYFVLPDGSGAIMPFETVASGSDHYEAAVYGSDDALRQRLTTTKSADVLMPIFGACYNDSGFLAVIEEGEALADILAYNSGSTDAYSKVYSRLNFLRTESVALGNQTASDNFNYYNFQDKPYKGNYAVRYIILGQDSCDYNGMAKVYRNYLTSTKKLTQKENEDKAPFVLETVGGILSDKSFLGFQYKGITALTEYEENTKMVETLKFAGVENIKLRLTAFNGDGMQNMLPVKVKLINTLGGSKGFEKLVSASIEKGFELYPDFEYLTFSANSGINAKNNYAVKSMDSKAVELDVLNSATVMKNTQIDDNSYYLTRLSKLSKINSGIEKHLNKYGLKQLSIADMASGVHSDYTASAAYDRQSAMNVSVKLLEDISSGYRLMLNAANANTVNFATLLTEAPLWSSQYEYTEEIPFFSLVYHGMVGYTGNSLNLASDSSNEFLRCVEYGALLKYTLVYKNESAVKSSDYTHLYSTGFEDNLDELTENYSAVNGLYEKIADAQMVSHKKISESVYLTEYSNGVLTVVNYSDTDYSSEYGAVPAKGFIVKG